MMKKFLILIFSVLMALCCLVGCNKGNDSSNNGGNSGGASNIPQAGDILNDDIISRTEITIREGETYVLKLNLILAEGKDASNYTGIWVSTNKDIVSVDKNGLVKANSVGTAMITVMCEDKQDSCVVHVVPKGTDYAVKLSKTTVSMVIESIISIEAFVLLDREVVDKEVTWIIPKDIATYANVSVDGNRLTIESYSIGKFEIVAQYQGCEAVCKVEIVMPSGD